MNDTVIKKRCLECGKRELRPDVIYHNARVKHDGSVHEIAIPQMHVLKCRSCGDVLFDDITDEQISQALRNHLGLLSPQEIREQLQRFGLTQKDFSACIRIAPETVSRWLSGAYIQSCAYDTLMRMFFEREESKHPVCGAQQVTISDGKLFPWSFPQPYHFASETTDAQEMEGYTNNGEWALAA
ncbi:MAG: hypothetical protein JW959_15230 [Pirellulales bacterium]|nr:hypothetical protein [Pirellulales bacterium]